MRLSRERIILKQGAVWAAHDALTSFYLSAFAVSQGASNTVIGLLGSIPFLAVFLSEYVGVLLIEKLPRNIIVFITGVSARALWIVIGLLPFFLDSPIVGIVVVYFVSKFIEFLGDPAWTSLVGDAVDEKKRGLFFGRRNRVITFWNTVVVVIAGLFLSRYGNYSIVFAAGALLGVWSGFLAKKVKLKELSHTHHTIKEFVHVKGEFLHFCLAIMVFQFGVMIAAPLFTVYILKNLGMAVQFVAFTTAVTTLSKFAFYPLIGKLADRFGDKVVSIISMVGIAFVPLMYVFVTQQPYWIFLISIFAGVVWAGADIAHFNMLLDLSKPDTRAVMAAEFNTLVSIPMAVAPFLGGLLADNAFVFLSGIPLVFVISFIIRLFSVVPMMHLHEPRIHKESSVLEVIREVVIGYPSRGFSHSWRIFSKYAKRSS